MPDSLYLAKGIWQDKEGNRSAMSLRFPSSMSSSEVFSEALAIFNTVKTVSDAVLFMINTSLTVRIPDPGEPGPDSDASRFAWLFYRNEDGLYEALRIPSIKISLIQTEGPYAGVALVDKTTAEGSAFLPLESALAATVDPEGEEWPPEYVNGGVML